MRTAVPAFDTEALAARLQGTHSGRRQTLSALTTDTRAAGPGDLFVALSGARHDGHRFIEQALASGCSALLVARGRGPSTLSPEVAIIEVADTHRALLAWAEAHRRAVPARFVALTGSSGKTTTKELLGTLLGAHGRTHKTKANENNLFGVPFTLLRTPQDARYAIVEVGTNHPGEIRAGVAPVRPDVAMLLNVGSAHVGNFSGVDGLLAEKLDIFSTLTPQDGAVYPADDDRIVAAMTGRAGRHRRFGRGPHPGADVSVVATEVCAADGTAGLRQQVDLVVDGGPQRFVLSQIGPHIAVNLAAAVAAMTLLEPAPDWAACRAAVEGMPAPSGRGVPFECGDFMVVDESYNANPESMRAAVEAARTRAEASGGRLLVALGQMEELGAETDHMHRVLQAYLRAESGAALGVLVGGAWDQSGQDPSFPVFTQHEDAFRWLQSRLQAKDVVVVKGSRSAGMERVVAWLRAPEETA